MATELSSFAELKKAPLAPVQAPAPIREKEVDAQGRAYATGRRKNAVARVWVKPGTGKITVNGRDQTVLFDMAEWRRGAPPLELRPGRYCFELFLKASNRSQPRLELRFEHTLEPKQLEDYRNGSTVYLINYEVTLPSIRRALAGAEWLPRAAPN